MGTTNLEKKKIYNSSPDTYVTYIGSGKGETISAKTAKGAKSAPKGYVKRYVNGYLPKTVNGKTPSEGRLEHPNNLFITRIRKDVYENNKDILYVFSEPVAKTGQFDPKEITEFYSKVYGVYFKYNEKTKIFSKGDKEDPIVEDPPVEEPPVEEPIVDPSKK